MINDNQQKQLEKEKNIQARANTAQATEMPLKKKTNILEKTPLKQRTLTKIGLSQTPLNRLNSKTNNKSLINKNNEKLKRGQSETPSNLVSSLPKALKKPQHNFFNNQNSSANSNFSSDLNDDLEDTSSNNQSSLLSDKSKLLIVKKMAPIIAISAAFFVVLMLVIIFFGNIISSLESVFGLFYHNTENADYVYNNNTELNEKEKKYYDQIQEVIDDYQSKYGVSLDKILLQIVLEYKYTAVLVDDMYTDAELDEEAFEESINSLEENSSENESNVDYDAMKKKIKTVASLMISKENGIYKTDTKIDGLFYNKLIESKFFKSYYKDLLKDNELETRKKLANDIWEQYELAKEVIIDTNNTGFVSSNLKVYLQTCNPARPYHTKFIDGIEVYNNQLANAETGYELYLTFDDYLKGVISGEVGKYMKEKYREGIKAMMVASSSYILGDSKSGFDLRIGEIYYPTGNCRQVSCDPNNGCVYRNTGEFDTAFSGTNGSKGVHKPLTEAQQELLDSILAEVFGEVMVKKGTTNETFVGSELIIRGNYYNKVSNCNYKYCMGQEEAFADALAGMNYRDILTKYYGTDFDIINIKEGLYIETTGNYNGTIQLNENFHYHQDDSQWANVKLCGSNDMATSGCNITSAAIAISLLTNQKITPITLNNRQKEIKTCNSGSRPEMIMDFAKLYGLKATSILKSDTQTVNDMLKKLATGNYVAIIRFGANSGRYNTINGHFVTAVGVKTENGRTKLLIWDPATTSKNRDNYWADLNDDILKYVRDSHSFILIGRN